jgi:2-oxoglutarate ferredoxin oxidoreductase subunit alpha
LMVENFGLGIMMETPCVVVNVQRTSPSTGLPTSWGQSDMMQARWGSHGDYGTIALCPKSPQEFFDLTILAFNYAEKYRLPVVILADAVVGHMTEKVMIPSIDQIKVVNRKYTKKGPQDYLPYAVNKSLVPEFAKVGDGYRFHSTGLTHDERGYPVMTEECQLKCVPRLIEKIKKNADDIVLVEEKNIEDADVVVVCYGITSRTVIPAIEMARKKGIKVGYLRLITAWPFPDKKIEKIAQKVKGFVVPELNMGQMVLEVERCVRKIVPVKSVPHPGGGFHKHEDVFKAIKEVANG